jgi:hypothetical protein
MKISFIVLAQRHLFQCLRYANHYFPILKVGQVNTLIMEPSSSNGKGIQFRIILIQILEVYLATNWYPIAYPLHSTLPLRDY